MRVTLFLFGTLLLVTSCKKEYACECFVGQQSLGAKTQILKKSEAEDWCKNNEAQNGSQIITCELVD